MRTFLTPGLVLILQAGSIALAGFVPATLLDVFRPEGQQIRLNVQNAAGRLIETVAPGRRAAGQGMIALALRPPPRGSTSPASR